jgi:hypothetical protein
VSNVLNEQKKQQIIALGRLGWSLRRIQKSTGVRRETVAAYLREAGVAIRSPGLWGHDSATATVTKAGPPRSKPATEVTTDFGAELATGTEPSDTAIVVTADPTQAKPAIAVTTDSGEVPDEEAPPPPPPVSASVCAVHRDAIELGLARGRNAMAIWQRAQTARRPVQAGLRGNPDCTR